MSSDSDFLQRDSEGDGRAKWFNVARVVDDEWVELEVTTTKGVLVQYRLPRRTLFSVIDRQNNS